MSRYLQRSWSVILQQAWNLRLKDRISFNNYNDKSNKEASRLYAELLLCVCWHTEHI